MKPSNPALQLILVSLFFAAAILVASYLMKGTEYGDTATYVLIAIWFIPFSYLCAATQRKPCGACQRKESAAGSDGRSS